MRNPSELVFFVVVNLLYHISVGFSLFLLVHIILAHTPSQKGRLFVTAATFSLPIVFVWYPHNRSTLRDNRIQRERWGSYTIFTLRTTKKGLSARVSDNQSLHGYCYSYHCKEKKAHGLYNYQVIYIFLLCIKYILSCILNI